MSTSRVPVLGIGIDPIRRVELPSRVGQLIEQGDATIAYANVHVLNTAARDPGLHAFLEGVDLCYCDGNGVVLGARLLGHAIPERLTGADWIWDLADHAEGRWRLYWIGGHPGVTHEAAERLRERHPGLEIATDHGFHPPSGPEDIASVDRINQFQPHIVLVGMGTPIQERWVAERRNRIDAPVVWCLGATADFVSGKVERVGPDWLVERHEWLSRLIADPGRLWRRYLLGNSLFLARVARERVTGKA